VNIATTIKSQKDNYRFRSATWN